MRARGTARIDRVGEGPVLTRVIQPIAQPTLATVAIFPFRGAWNDVMGPPVSLYSDKKWPVTRAPRYRIPTYTTWWPSHTAIYHAWSCR